MDSIALFFELYILTSSFFNTSITFIKSPPLLNIVYIGLSVSFSMTEICSLVNSLFTYLNLTVPVIHV